jgi:hypothetical protein
MKKEEKGEREEVMSKAGKPRWQYFSPIRWPPPGSEDTRNWGVHKTFISNGEQTENMTATYWG